MTKAAIGQSRPLRAAGGIVFGWIVARAIMLWPPPVVPEVAARADRVEPVPVAAGLEVPQVEMAVSGVAQATEVPPRSPRSATVTRVSERAVGVTVPTAIEPLDFTLSAPSDDDTPSDASVRRRSSSLAAAIPEPPARDRFQLSGWLIARGSGNPGIAPSGTLGGSQAGVRLYFEPGPRGLALTARASAPLEGKSGREVAAGVALRRGALGLILEERVPIGGGPARPSVTAFGGIYDRKLPAGLRASGYVQAGAVGISAPLGFADGQLRVERPIVTIGRARIDLGANLSGGVQPHLARLDLGPELALRVPVEQGALRLSVGWRARIAGDAAPQSGPVLTIGADF